MASDRAKGTFNLGKAFIERQRLLSSELEIPLAFTTHPTTIGDGSEANWQRMLGSFLPARYAVGPIFALDAVGGTSEQVDLAIYDRQYSPLWFEISGKRFVPVESVYAVLEVKQTINKTNLDYAGKKAASVRALHRTSGRIEDIHGLQVGPAPERRPILGGIVALRSTWAGGLQSTTAASGIRTLKGNKHLDLGIALTDTAFDHTPSPCSDMLIPGLTFSRPGTQLIYFVLHLFRRLQAIGTAMAVDLDVYERALDEVDPDLVDDDGSEPRT